MSSGPIRTTTEGGSPPAARARRRTRLALAFAAAILANGATCAGPVRQEVSRVRAIDLARQEISFPPETVDAERTFMGPRAVWRVTFRGRLPGQPPGLFETVTVDVDRQTGEIVAVARP